MRHAAVQVLDGADRQGVAFKIPPEVHELRPTNHRNCNHTHHGDQLGLLQVGEQSTHCPTEHQEQLQTEDPAAKASYVTLVRAHLLHESQLGVLFWLHR